MKHIQAAQSHGTCCFAYACFLLFVNQLAGKIIHLITIPVQNKRTCCPLYKGTSAHIIIIHTITALAFPGNHFIVIILVVNHLCIIKFPVVTLIMKTATQSRHLVGVINTQRPAANIDFMCCIVQQLACPPVPEPVPVIMYYIIPVFGSWCRSLPELPVQPFRYCYLFPYPNGSSCIGIPCFAKIRFTYIPPSYPFDCFNICWC